MAELRDRWLRQSGVTSRLVGFELRDANVEGIVGVIWVRAFFIVRVSGMCAAVRFQIDHQ